MTAPTAGLIVPASRAAANREVNTPMRGLIRILPVLVLLAGCAGAPVEPAKPTPSGTPDEAAVQALQAGEYHAAARLFLELAARSTGYERAGYQLQGVNALLRAGLDRQAQRLIEEIEPAGLPPALAMRHQLLAAELQLSESPDRALSLLLEPAAPEHEEALHARYHHLRARAFVRIGNHLEAAREYIERELFLTEPETIEANQLATWEALSYLSNDALERLRVQPPPNVLSGWMELAAIAKDVDQTADHVAERLDMWRQRYPAHPVLPSFLRTLERRSRDLVTRPNQIGVLLPFSGRFAAAGAAVRDGLLAAYYRDPRRSEVSLRFYNVGEAGDVLGVYEQAVADGAGLVIGPLDKEAVQALAEQSELAVPTLALNDAMQPNNDQLYQFGLPPEEEARQVAELAWLDGHDNAAVLTPKGAWGERLRDAFAERWESLGGRVVSSASYDPQKSDFSRPIKALLNIDQSQARRIAVQDLLRERVEFDPRRRQDVDFVFLGAFPVQARLIRPQLRFHHAIGLPVYGTSHLYTGHPDAAQDRDMDGIVFGDMPWTLDIETSNVELRHEGQERLKVHGGALQRLVALGVDAYHLVPRLKMLAAYPQDRFQGETGILRVDGTRRVHRHLNWARFVRGEPRRVDADVMLLRAGDDAAVGY